MQAGPGDFVRADDGEPAAHGPGGAEESENGPVPARRDRFDVALGLFHSRAADPEHCEPAENDAHDERAGGMSRDSGPAIRERPGTKIAEEHLAGYGACDCDSAVHDSRQAARRIAGKLAIDAVHVPGKSDDVDDRPECYREEGQTVSDTQAYLGRRSRRPKHEYRQRERDQRAHGLLIQSG